MTMKSDAKFEQKLTFGSKNDTRNLVSFNASSGKSGDLMCYLCLKYIKFQGKKRAEELCIITLKNDAKFEEELTCGLKNDTRNLANIDPTFKSLKICTLMGSF